MCAYDYTHLRLGYKNKKEAKRYTYQNQTVKPVFMADSVASVTELIAAGHSCVPVQHVAPPPVQALCGIQYDKVHASLTERDEGNWKHERT
jgi:hypothetical protein